MDHTINIRAIENGDFVSYDWGPYKEMKRFIKEQIKKAEERGVREFLKQK